MYWHGNAAKSRIIGDIISRGGSPLVFDYGAGRGGDWPEVLRAHPNIRLVCFEPDPNAAAVLAERLKGLATVHRSRIEDLAIQADYIVSFSVFEHVADRPTYMANAARLLAPHGRFYLNYDDGHFRAPIDLLNPRTWKRGITHALIRLAAPIRYRLGDEGQYLRRVTAQEADDLAKQAGFRIVSARYENLEAFKALAKVIPSERRDDFATLWASVEDALNERFQSPHLWSAMGSLTLELVKS